MRAEMLAIGDELLDGRVADTNSLHLAQALSERGVHLAQVGHVPDDLAAIIDAARASAARGAQLCVVSGGLGPTADDLTAQAFAHLAGVPLARDADEVAKIEAHIRRRRRPVTANQLRQADRPAGGTLLANPLGTACGFALAHGGCRFVALPGVPGEFRGMLGHVLAGIDAGEPVARRRLSVFGLAEAEVDHRLGDISARWPEVRLQFRTQFPVNHVGMHAAQAHLGALDEALAHARHRLGEHVYTSEGVGLAEVVVRQLAARDESLAVAESCTGGLLAGLVTGVPGASGTFRLGVVAYQDAAKERLLSVDPAVLAEHGAVSERVALAMARGVRPAATASWGLATTGIAGPGGGTRDRPVGLTFLAAAGPGGLGRTARLELSYGRDGNRQFAAHAALDLVRRLIADHPPPAG